jgi:hypothetical protein
MPFQSVNRTHRRKMLSVKKQDEIGARYPLRTSATERGQWRKGGWVKAKIFNPSHNKNRASY